MLRVAWFYFCLCLLGLGTAYATEFEDQVIDFPNLVTPQPLEQVSRLPNGSEYQIQAIDFATHRYSIKEIRMPLKGSFNVVFQSGEGFRILDNDATDGEAKVQLPASNFDLYLRAVDSQVPGNTQATVTLEDHLYYVNQAFRPTPDLGWYKLSARPMPVPENWYSSHGNQYVLRLFNSGATNIYFYWTLSGKEAIYPPGLKKIGPEGGTVELPGVAKLEIPEGALSQTTIVKISQVMSAPFRGYYKLPPEYAWRPHQDTTGTEYASPVILLEPFKTRLIVPGKLSVFLLDPTYQKISPRSVTNLVTENIEDESGGGRHLEGNEGIHSPISVSEFVFYGKLVRYGWLKAFGENN